MPGSTRGDRFHYDVSTTSTHVDGTIDLTATGRSGDDTRSIRVVLRRGGFGEFLYYTVYETIDPANESVYGVNNTRAQERCSHYYWEPDTATSRPRDTGYCQDLNFVSGDRINGPLHTNDTMLISGSTRFSGTTTTSDPACRAVNGTPPAATACYRVNDGSSNRPVFERGIAYRSEVELPTSIGDLKPYVDPAQTTTPGCLYTGPTRIRLLPSAAGSTPMMKVWSKWSRSPLNPGCGVHTNAWPQTVPVPQNNLVMVRNVPSTQSTPSSGRCSAGSVGDGFPQADDANESLAEMDCRNGNLYVEGSLRGRLSISADNNIIVTGDLTYAGGQNGTDALGLIAQNSVKVYHPVARGLHDRRYRWYCGWYCARYDYTDMTRPNGTHLRDVSIDAAILTLQHSFGVQAYDEGAPRGTIDVFGSIAQRYRGPVGTGGSSISTGYYKNYNYDTRLRYAPPPYFLDPVRSSWGQKTFGEVSALYDD